MRVISWIKAAQKDFEKFPLEARQKTIRALKIAAEGEYTMKKERLEVVRGSDNPFRDVGLPNPELENARATLAAEIIGILNERNLSKRKAASITGIDPADITRIRNADLKGFSMDRMIKILATLNHRVEVRVHPIRTRRSKSVNVLHA